YVVESQFSITGANADHRLRLRSSDIRDFASDLAGEMKIGGNELKVLSGSKDEKRTKWLAAVAKDLKEHQGKSVVVAGPRQPAAVHALAFLMNQSLGNIGTTVSFYKAASDQTVSQLDALRGLVGEMSRGQVSHLVMLGGNPVYTAPADFDFPANLKKVANSVYLGFEPDETAVASKWLIPEAHFLESWGDVVAPDGTVTFQQPMIEPLFGGKTAAEVVALLTGNKETRGYDIVRAYWVSKLGGEKVWRKSLHDGVVPNTAAAPVTPTLDAKRVNAASQGTAPRSGMELVFLQSAATYDGRFANNGWLQELPDPMHKLTWDNAALLSPATARQIGVKHGDLIAIERAGRSLEAPVVVQPGYADNSIGIALGYGRTECGRIGKDVGANAYKLRTSDAFAFATDITVKKTGREYPLALTQEHNVVEPLGTAEVKTRIPTLIREATVEEFRKEPKFVQEFEEHPPLLSLYGDWDYSKGQQWGMAIDLNSCIGCNACMIACQAENNIPIVGKDQVARGREMHWIRLDRYYKGDENDPESVTQPIPCMQCENAPCENVCPVAATAHSPEGLNDMAYNRCVGTRYCSNNCPYKVRRFNFLNWHYGEAEVHKMVFNPDVTVRMRGVMEKCTFCVQRIQAKKIEAKAAERRQWLNDGEVQTACQQTCPADAIVFGNINDAGSRVAKMKAESRNYAMLSELNTKPRTTFLAKLRNPNPELEERHG
ncbi:MAG TPA: 4Fe-4S dicluster domain-containing protein, partial [Bryobacteraceae bacterium]|nr:4Fe-4S dicluster domain-containing protein [Bryobacteraceae bacterium]